VNVVKSTLGGPQGNFEEAVAAIANAELLMEKQPESFFKVQRAADFDRAKNEGKLASFTRSNRRTCSRTR
jgi:membrane dipeptidase